MAKSSEIVQVEQIDSGLTKLNTTMNTTVETYLKLVKTISDGNKTISDSVVSTGGLAKAQKETVDNAKKIDELNKKVIDSENKLNETEEKSIATLIKLRLEKQKATKETTLLIKAQQAEKGSKEQLIAVNAILENRLNKVNLSTEEGRKKVDLLRSAIDRNNVTIKENSSALGAQRINIGNYGSALSGLKEKFLAGEISAGGLALGIKSIGKAALAFFLTPIGMAIAAIGGLVMAGKALVNNAIEFQRAASSLSAITGAVGGDLDFMKKKAREFAVGSESSATEIIKAFEKVGSAMPKLLKQKELLTEVTFNAIKLSESTGGKLAVEDAAKAAAMALNQFNIPLTESGRAVNVLAAGSLAGSAEVLDLTESFKNVGAVAANANMTLEQTVAALEVLGEKGLYGAEAGTKLRGALLEMQKAGIGFASGQFNVNDALLETKLIIDEIKDPIKKAQEQLNIFGKENITAGIILTSSIDKFNALTESVTGTKTAYEQAAIQTDNLQGSYKILGNVWDGLMLKIEDGDGVFMKVWRGIVDVTAYSLFKLTTLFEDVGNLFDVFRSKESIAANKREKEIKSTLVAEKAAINEIKALEEAKSAMVVTKAEESDKATKKAEAKSKAANKESIKIAKEKDKEIAQNKIKWLKDIDDNMKKSISEQEKAADESAKQADDELNQWMTDEEKKTEKLKTENEKQLDEDKKAAEKKKDIAEKVRDMQIEIASEAINGIFDLGSAKRDEELNALDKEKERKLSNDKLTADQKEKIEADYAKKAAAIKTKQAKADKLQALFNIALSTAAGIMEAAPILPLMALVGALGAVQSAFVLSTPIPKFKAGTLNAPDNGIFGEAGRELMFLKSGEVTMANKATYFEGSKFKGAQIVSNPDTEKMIKAAESSGMSGRTMTDDRLLNEMRLTRKAIMNKPVAIVDKQNRQIGYGTSNHQTIYLNKLTHKN